MSTEYKDEGISALAEVADQALPGEEVFDDDAPVSFESDEPERPKPQVSQQEAVQTQPLEKKSKKGLVIGLIVLGVVAAASIAAFFILDDDGFSHSRAVEADSTFGQTQGFLPVSEPAITPQKFDNPPSMQSDRRIDPMVNNDIQPVNFTDDDLAVTAKESSDNRGIGTGISTEEMGEILQGMEKSLASKIPDISRFVAELNLIAAEQRKISATMLNMNRTLGELASKQDSFIKKVQSMRLSVAPAKKYKKKKAKVHKAKYEYVLVGAIEGKAWIKNKGESRIVTIFEGDNLKHYGKVTKILSNGTITTSRGVVKVTYPQ